MIDRVGGKRGRVSLRGRVDVAAAKKALKEKGSIPWAEVKPSAADALAKIPQPHRGHIVRKAGCGLGAYWIYNPPEGSAYAG